MRYLDHNPKVVALVGMGPSIVDIFNETLTQECSPNWVDEVWAINMVANTVEHDLVFWMDDFKEQQNFKPGLFELLRRRGKPVITSVAHTDIVPNSYDYPVSEVSQFSIPYFGKPYLTNGVAMGIAYAMWKEVKVLKIYGCDFTYPNRNFAEEGRACTEAWITLASTKGMEVQLSPATSLFDVAKDTGIYGYAQQPLIEGPDGVTFRYEKQAGKYKPEDSSGNVAALLPRSPGQPATPVRDGQGEQRTAPPAAVESIAKSGAGLRSPDQHGPAEETDPAGDGSGSEFGSLPREAPKALLSA